MLKSHLSVRMGKAQNQKTHMYANEASRRIAEIPPTCMESMD